jgi:N6-L-threonylcarbamoyladenine synthase
VVDTLAIKCERALDAPAATPWWSPAAWARTSACARSCDDGAKRGGRVCFPRPALCTDNGAMIAFAGALRLEAGQREDAAVHVAPRWDMATLPAV